MAQLIRSIECATNEHRKCTRKDCECYCHHCGNPLRDSMQPERLSVNGIIIELLKIRKDGMRELSRNELSWLIFQETDDKFLEAIKYAIGVLSNEAPQKYKDVIWKLKECLPPIHARG